MGDTTDELLDLAKQVSPLPPGRELDMLLTAGERISMALLAMAIANLGLEARSFTGSQAGVITDSAHGNARIIDVTPGRIQAALGDGAIPIVAGFQGVSQDTKDITTLGRGGRTPRRSRWPRPWAPTSARSTPTSTASSPPTRGSCPAPGGSRGSRTRRCWRWRPAGRRSCMLRCVEYARRYGIPIHVRSSFSNREGTWVAARQAPETEGREMEQAIISGVAHDRSEAKITVVGVPDKPGEAAQDLPRGRRRGDQHRHDRAERLGRRDRAHRHLVHAAAGGRPGGHDRAAAAAGRGRVRLAALRRPDRQGLADRRRHAVPPRRQRRPSSARWPRPGSTSR